LSELLLSPTLEGDVRRQRLGPGVEKRRVPTTTSRLVHLVDVHLAGTRTTGNLHGQGVPLGADGLWNGPGASLLVTKLGEEERDLVTPRGHEGLGGGEFLEERVVPRSPSDATLHLALASTNAEVKLPRGGRSAELQRVDSKTVGNKRTVTTDDGLHELLSLAGTVDLTNEDLSSLRNATELLERLELVPAGNVEATVELSLSGKGGSNALVRGSSSVVDLTIGAEHMMIVGLVPH